VRPANLTAGVYRGGRRPIDLYWRLRGGIPPSGMPALADLSDAELWDVVAFLQALPYPEGGEHGLPPSVREKVYPAPKAAPEEKPEHH
jgi:mono/diheme cytochrome c family protein